MRTTLGLALFLAIPASLAAQYRGGAPRTFGSPTGFGNILYPGTGNAPPIGVTGSITNPGFASSLGRTVSGIQVFTGRPPQTVYPGRNNTVVVPYAYPVMVGGYDQYYQQPAPPQQPIVVQQPAPTVIINQHFTPETLRPSYRDLTQDAPATQESGGMRSYEAPTPGRMEDPRAAAPRQPVEEAKPTLYLIAYKDGKMYSAVAYWIEGDTLNYVTQKGTINRASLDLIDREMSEQLNKERNVEFSLHK